MNTNILFITGTDTGIGKTVVASLTAIVLRKAGLRVNVFKPVETGCAVSEEGTLSASDAEQLRIASGSLQSIEQVVPYTFSAPLAPSVAAVAEGKTIDPLRIRDAAKELASNCDLLIVEGAGGILVPIVPGYRFVDLAAELNAISLLVVGSRLGAINHCLLTLETLCSRGLSCAGYVLNNCMSPEQIAQTNSVQAQQSNRESIREEAALYGARELLFLEHITDVADMTSLEARVESADLLQYATDIRASFGNS